MTASAIGSRPRRPIGRSTAPCTVAERSVAGARTRRDSSSNASRSVGEDAHCARGRIDEDDPFVAVDHHDAVIESLDDQRRQRLWIGDDRARSGALWRLTARRPGACGQAESRAPGPGPSAPATAHTAITATPAMVRAAATPVGRSGIDPAGPPPAVHRLYGGNSPGQHRRVGRQTTLQCTRLRGSECATFTTTNSTTSARRSSR